MNGGWQRSETEFSRAVGGWLLQIQTQKVLTDQIWKRNRRNKVSGDTRRVVGGRQGAKTSWFLTL